FLYLGATIVLTGILPWSQAGVTESPFVTVFAAARLPAVRHIMNFVVLTAALSGSNASLYVTSRMLYSLAQSGYAPRRLVTLDASGAPRWSLLASTVGILVALVVEYFTPANAFLYIIGASLFGGMLAWGIALPSHVAMRRQITPGGMAARAMRATGNQVGALLNAPANSVSRHQNVAQCQAVVASCFDFSGRRNKVVYTDMNFPSVMYFWEAQRSRGARVHMVPTDDGITVPLVRLLAAIDEETLLVPISHVIFRSSFINDAEAIIARAHQVGAHVVLDCFQSLGSGVHVVAAAWNVDVGCCGLLNWLCGGPGTAYLYVHPVLATTLETTFTAS